MKIYCTSLRNGVTTYILTSPKIIVVKSFSAKTSFAHFQLESFMGKVHLQILQIKVIPALNSTFMTMK